MFSDARMQEEARLYEAELESVRRMWNRKFDEIENDPRSTQFGLLGQSFLSPSTLSERELTR